MQSLSNRLAIALQSLGNHFIIALQPLYNRFIIALQSLCNRFIIALQSLCKRFATALQSLCNRFAIACHRSIIALRRLTTPLCLLLIGESVEFDARAQSMQLSWRKFCGVDRCTCRSYDVLNGTSVVRSRRFCLKLHRWNFTRARAAISRRKACALSIDVLSRSLRCSEGG
jgi:hypothetical protein